MTKTPIEIPQHLIDKWTKEAEALYQLFSDSISMVIASKRNAYIEGCKSTYLEMVGEQKRITELLLGMVYRETFSVMSEAYCCTEISYEEAKKSVETYKLKHNLL